MLTFKYFSYHYYAQLFIFKLIIDRKATDFRSFVYYVSKTNRHIILVAGFLLARVEEHLCLGTIVPLNRFNITDGRRGAIIFTNEKCIPNYFYISLERTFQLTMKAKIRTITSPLVPFSWGNEDS